jgi:S1-C subfamily serine protease
MKGSMMRTLKTFAMVLAFTLGTSVQAFADSPYLGVYLVDETDSKNGALVEGVKEGSPAHNAGIRKGDLILKYNGATTPNGATLIKQIVSSKAGSKVTLIASRNGWNKTINLTLGSNNPDAKKTEPAPKPAAGGQGFLGVYLASGEGNGAVVDGTVKDSPARKVGLKKGDVIIGVNGKKVAGQEDLISVLKGLTAGTAVKLRIKRDGWGKDVNVTLGQRPQRPAPDRAEPKATPKPTPKATPKPAAKKRGFFGVALDEANGKVVVDEVQAGSAAEKSSMAKGDVIISVNGKNINSINDFAAALKGKYAGDKLTVVISRDGWKRTVKVVLSAGK